MTGTTLVVVLWFLVLALVYRLMGNYVLAYLSIGFALVFWWVM